MHKEFLFPYETIRDEQNKLLADVTNAIASGKNLLAHAPTGLGKTIAALGPALKYAMENNKTVFFLTSRHTQHLLAVKTVKDIMDAFGVNIICCDIIAKKWMCAQPGVEAMPSSAFYEYCKSMREESQCEFYNNTKFKGKIGPKAQQVLYDLKSHMPLSTEEINKHCREAKVCPYEIASLLGSEAHIVIADYNYMFNSRMRESFLKRSGKKLEDSIIIVDEGHNLPSRCRDMQSSSLSSFVIDRAIKECEKYEYDELKEKIQFIEKLLADLSSELSYEKQEDFVLKGEFHKPIEEKYNYSELLTELEAAADHIREEQRQSFIGSISQFMIDWMGENRGFSRIISLKQYKNSNQIVLNYTCLDPSFVTSEVINGCVSTILMSGTLNPAEMYADLLGFKNYDDKEYDNPFNQDNRLSMVIEDVTTRYAARGAEQYKKIAQILTEVTTNIPGNSIVFFPSYAFRDDVYKYFRALSRKTVILEAPGMSKEEKQGLLEKFKTYKNSGAILLGVAQGSFGEGVDLPGDLLKGVIVVGIPLTKPDLETKELIEYYEDRFGEGMNYGYIYPAITKTLQNAGRCIRSETDRGVIVFMDERYATENYERCFPKDWNMKVTKMWSDRVSKFFSVQKSLDKN